jgi:hypothetical protein
MCIFKVMEENISVKEYEEHKNKCGKSFEEVFNQIEKLNRAILGEPELKKKGLIEMTEQMYESVMMARGGQKVFLTLVKIAGAVITIITAFWVVYEFFKRVNIK